ncbi:MAG: FimV/HubP family polar landmark protein [Steroidobacterales bacterium]
MFAKMPRLLLTACIICPSLARALGLGEIHLNSALNEPLRAEIDLVAVTPDELTALRATMASREAFTRYGIDRPAFISSFTFKVAKSAEGRDVLQVRSTDSIPEPFVTFLVEVNWARGRLMREYTVLLDPPTYTPGESPGSTAPVAGATAAAIPAPQSPAQPAPSMPAAAQGSPASPRRSSMSPPATAPAPAGSYRTVSGDTLMRIAQRTHGGGTAQVDQTMLAIYRANPDAFEGNINLLRRGTVLRIPGADEIAALNQKEAMDEVARQMSAWRNGAAASASGGRLRLVTPRAAGEGTGSGATGGAAGSSDVATLKGRVKELESQLAESRRLLDVSNGQLADLQHKLASAQAAAAAAGAAAAGKPPVVAAPATPAAPPAAAPAAPTPTEAQNAAPSAAAPAAEAPASAAAPIPAVPAASPSGSWLDWIVDHWQIPGALVALLLAALGFTAFRRRQRSADADGLSALAGTAAQRAEPSPRDYAGSYKVTETFGPGDTAEIKALEPAPAPVKAPTEAVGAKLADETMSAESPVTIDQGDPIAEADFHMAYGLYDQAADLVRIALEREPERRDLQMKLLEIYFVWGNAENFLHAAKELAATRDRAPAGEWEKIVIMGKQICPDEELFKQGSAGMHGANTSVDLNLDGGENRLDIDLFSETSVEQGGARQVSAKSDDSLADTAESPHLQDRGLDFVLDAPERGAEPPHAQAARAEPLHDEPTIESEQLVFGNAQPAARASEDHTAEVEIHDLGFDLDHLEATDTPAAVSASLEKTDQSAGNAAPTVVSGMDESVRQRLADAASSAKDSDLTQLERELEASFIAELAASSDDIKESIVQESAPTVNMAANVDAAQTGKFKRIDTTADTTETEVMGTDSTAQMEGIDPNNVDLDFSQLTHDMGPGGDAHAAPGGEATGVREAFDNSQRVRSIDLDTSESVNRSAIPNAMDTLEARQLIVKSDTIIPGGEFAPVTMSEVGTKLDLARAYMDMGDPEGARSILEEVVQEGSASQKKEATRLIQSLPG